MWTMYIVTIEHNIQNKFRKLKKKQYIFELLPTWSLFISVNEKSMTSSKVNTTHVQI